MKRWCALLFVFEPVPPGFSGAITKDTDYAGAAVVLIRDRRSDLTTFSLHARF